MSNTNNIQLAGRLKNIRVFTERGTMVTAQLTQRNEEGKATFTIPICSFDPKMVAALKAMGEHVGDSGTTDEVVVSGKLNTRFAQNPDGTWKAPFTRVLVDAVTQA